MGGVLVALPYSCDLLGLNGNEAASACVAVTFFTAASAGDGFPSLRVRAGPLTVERALVVAPGEVLPDCDGFPEVESGVFLAAMERCLKQGVGLDPIEERAFCTARIPSSGRRRWARGCLTFDPTETE